MFSEFRHMTSACVMFSQFQKVGHTRAQGSVSEAKLHLTSINTTPPSHLPPWMQGPACPSLLPISLTHPSSSHHLMDLATPPLHRSIPLAESETHCLTHLATPCCMHPSPSPLIHSRATPPTSPPPCYTSARAPALMQSQRVLISVN